MKNFEERKKEYFGRLRKYIKNLNELSKYEQNKKMLELLLNPQNEKELEIGNLYIRFIEDLFCISTHAICDNIEEIDPENSALTEYLSKYITAVSRNDSAEELKKMSEPYKADGGKLFAEVLYQMSALMLNNNEGVVQSVCARCNIDISDELELKRFNVLLEMAAEKINAEPAFNTENFDEFISLVNHYHTFCINGIKDHNNSKVKEVLAQLQEDSTDSPKISEGKSRKRNIQTE